MLTSGPVITAAAIFALWLIEQLCSAGESFTRHLVRDLFLWLDK